jgi:5'-nucleotidase
MIPSLHEPYSVGPPVQLIFQDSDKKKEQGKRDITLLITGDTHSYLDATKALFVSEKPLGGIVRRIQYIEQVRSLSKQPVLVLDAGDFLQGTPYFEKFEGEADLKFMNLAGYDVITVGNHDFDKGWPHLQKLLKQGKFQSVCANISLDGEQDPCLPPYVILKIEDQSIAVVGVMGLDSWLSISPSQRKGLQIKDPIKTLDEVLPEIRSRVDLIILLSHSGIKDDRELAKHPLVDIVIGGHSHTWMKEQELIKTECSDKVTPVFHTFRHGMLVGKMDIHFKEGKFVNTSSSTQYLDEQFDSSKNDLFPSAQQAKALLQKYQTQLEGYKMAFGECVESIPSKDKGLKLVPLGEAIAEALQDISKADVGVIPSGSIKVGIEKGPFTREALHSLLAHSEPLVALKIKGDLLLSLMQNGHERWGKERSFQYSGIALKIENSKVVSAQMAGSELDRDAIYTIAGPSFFFEREFMDKDKKVLPKFSHQVKEIKEVHADLRAALAERIATKGLGRWVNGSRQEMNKEESKEDGSIDMCG